MKLFLLLLALGALAENCYNVSQSRFRVCDPTVIQVNEDWKGNVTNTTGWWFFPPVNDPNTDIIVELKLTKWIINGLEVPQYFLYYSLYDIQGTDYSSQALYPNASYMNVKARNTSYVFSKPVFPSQPYFFRIWVVNIDGPQIDIGPVELKYSYAANIASVPFLGTLTQKIQPGAYAIATWNWGKVDWAKPHENYADLYIDCGSSTKTPIPVYIKSCDFMCSYPDISNEFNSRSIYDHEKKQTYQMGYPYVNGNAQYDLSLIATFYNNQTTECTIRANAYYSFYTQLTYRSNTNLYTTISVTPNRYTPVMLYLPGSNSFLTNATVNFTITPKMPSNALLGLYYHPYPYNFDQNMVDATLDVKQSNPDESLSGSFMIWSPYQPFVIYNGGNGNGTFTLEIAPADPIVFGWYIWVAIGVGAALLAAIIVGAIYRRSKSGLYEQIQ